tara:strand:+ start:1283 stop:1795 length:513 start_codon:yes stop_codon:yes gene_type:complete
MMDAKYGFLTLCFFIVFVIVLVDQVTKIAVSDALSLGEVVRVSGVFSIVLWHNDGAAFSLLSGLGARWLLVTISIGFSIYLIWELLRLDERANRSLLGIAYAFVLGGALGNGLDRIFLGYVVDFALFHYGGWSFAAFNIADAFLTLGAFLWIICWFIEYKKPSSENIEPK